MTIHTQDPSVHAGYKWDFLIAQVCKNRNFFFWNGGGCEKGMWGQVELIKAVKSPNTDNEEDKCCQLLLKRHAIICHSN